MARRSYIVTLAVVAAIYIVVAGLGALIFDMNLGFDLVWMPAGLALAAVFLFGYRVWPAIAAAAFIFCFTTYQVQGFSVPASLLASSIISGGNVIAALAGVYLLRRFAGGSNPLGSTRDYLRFVLLAAILSTAVGSIILILGLSVAGIPPWGDFGALWTYSWAGSLTSVLIVTMFIMAWDAERQPSRNLAHILEALLPVLLAAACLQVILTRSTPGGATPPEVGLLIPPFIASLIWAAIRLGPRGISSALLLTWFIALLYTDRGTGSLVLDTAGQSFLMVQASWAALTIVIMIPAAAIVEGKDFAHQLQIAKNNYEALLNAQSELGQGLAVVDLTNQQLVFANTAFCRMTGYEQSELSSLPSIYSLLTLDQEEPIRRYIQTRLAGKSQEDNLETRLLRRDGNVMDIEVGIQELVADEGKQVVAITRDISDRKRAEKELSQAMAELERSNNDLQQFAYVASHDLQEPLRTVSNFVQLLEEGYTGTLDEDGRVFFHFVVDGTERMQRMIDDLLTYSRVNTQGEPFKSIDPGQALTQAIEALRFAIDESGAKVTYGPLPMVQADQTQLAQVFQNLLSNAIRFRCEEPPRIEISATPVDGFCRFSVRDNGIGIDPKYFDRIFVIFQHLNKKRDYPGTGIGLALCKRIVERHGGEIWVESETGKGATFHFTIPV